MKYLVSSEYFHTIYLVNSIDLVYVYMTVKSNSFQIINPISYVDVGYNHFTVIT
jgi:hypothetical protein